MLPPDQSGFCLVLIIKQEVQFNRQEVRNSGPVYLKSEFKVI